MATLGFDGVDDYIKINPLSTSLNNIPNGACTIAALVRRTSEATRDEAWGLRGGDLAGDFYHGIRLQESNTQADDDGIVAVEWTGNVCPTGTTVDDFFIVAVDWGTGASTERLHFSAKMGAAESWIHDNSDGNNGGQRAGPGTSTGFFLIGMYDSQWWLGDIALIAVWAGTRFSDAQVEALWANKRTSDWYLHPAGTPNTLIEVTSTSLVDIGSDPVSSIVVSGATATGLAPTGWTFDGQVAVEEGSQTMLPQSHITSSGMH